MFFAALALALAGCTKDNSEVLNNEGPVSARFTASIGNGATASTAAPDTSSTRVSGEDGDAWDNGDCIGITGAGYTNIPYVTGGDGNFTPTGTTIYYNDAQNYTFSAYCPYKDDSELTDGRITATTDAGAQNAQAEMDFLFASGATGSTSRPTVKFTFRHSMSRVTLTFEAGSSVDFSGGKPESYTLGGLQLDGTFDTATGIAAADEGAQSGELSIELADGNLTSSVILFPQTADALPLVVEYNGQEYKATLTVPDGALQAGNNYTWTVKVNNKGLDVGSATITAWNDKSSGEGEATILDYTISADGKTYTVYNAKGLLAWNEAVQSDLTLNCTLAADITMTGIDWTPVGNYDNRYTGTFDGNGHTITGLTVDLPNQGYVGLIGYLSGGTVQNLTLAEVEINGCDRVGGVAGWSNGTVTGCTVSGNVSGRSGVGGVVGYNGGTVTGCTISGNVSGSCDVGGVAGYNDTYGTVTGCTVSGNVSGGDNVGGVAGDNSGTVTGCGVTGAIGMNGEQAGGVAGYNATGTVTGCHATGNVSGDRWVGGVAGDNTYGTVTGCYATGNVSGTGNVGGVAGDNYGTVTGCYATGNVSGDRNVGGVAGDNSGTVTGCYATGNVSGDTSVGGVAGINDGTVTGCYWSNNIDAGIGGGNVGDGEATKVDGMTVTWVDAQRGMNEAIVAWNENNPNKQCNWRYAETDAETPPTLEPIND